jgi:hypothetical protein
MSRLGRTDLNRPIWKTVRDRSRLVRPRAPAGRRSDHRRGPPGVRAPSPARLLRRFAAGARRACFRPLRSSLASAGDVEGPPRFSGATGPPPAFASSLALTCACMRSISCEHGPARPPIVDRANRAALSISFRRAIMNSSPRAVNEHYNAPRIPSEPESLTAPQHPALSAAGSILW